MKMKLLGKKQTNKQTYFEYESEFMIKIQKAKGMKM